ncbi:MAG: hypothetical protein P8Y36_03990, partial [Alphaproteobacteria bacterium]
MRFITTVLLSLFCLLSHAAAGTLGSYKTGAWIISAHDNSDTGAFSHCSASVEYRSGILVIFTVDKNYVWSMSFANKEWTLTKGDRYDIAYSIDSGRKTYTN